MRSFKQQSVLDTVKVALSSPEIAVVTPDGTVHVHETLCADYLIRVTQALVEGLSEALEHFDPVVEVTYTKSPAPDPENEIEMVELEAGGYVPRMET